MPLQIWLPRHRECMFCLPAQRFACLRGRRWWWNSRDEAVKKAVTPYWASRDQGYYPETCRPWSCAGSSTVLHVVNIRNETPDSTPSNHVIRRHNKAIQCLTNGTLNPHSKIHRTNRTTQTSRRKLFTQELAPESSLELTLLEFHNWCQSSRD